jgi:hypothetical protein
MGIKRCNLHAKVSLLTESVIKKCLCNLYCAKGAIDTAETSLAKRVLETETMI